MSGIDFIAFSGVSLAWWFIWWITMKILRRKPLTEWWLRRHRWSMIGILLTVPAIFFTRGILLALAMWAIIGIHGMMVRDTAKRRELIKSGSNPKSETKPAFGPDIHKVNEILAAWPRTAFDVGLCVRDAALTDELGHAAQLDARPTQGWDAASDLIRARHRRKGVTSRSDVVVVGHTVYRTPQMIGVAERPWGLMMAVRQVSGLTVADHQARAVALADALHVPEVDIHQPEAERLSGTILIDVLLRDPLAAPRPSMDQSGAPGDTAMIGRTRDEDLALEVYEASHIAIQGATRSGKSALCYGLLSALANRQDVTIAGVDPSRLLLTAWRSRDDTRGEWLAASGDPDAGLAVLRELVSEMERRLELLVELGRDKLGPTSENPVIFVILEEFAGFVRAARNADRDRKPAERIAGEIERLVGRLVAESAKAGFRIVTITQRFDADLMGGGARAQFGTRITLRVESADDVRMLHPQATPEDVAEILAAPPGRGLVQLPGLGIRKGQMDITDYETYRQRVAQ